MSASRGVPIVLTADRTLTADYPTLFGGMVASSQTTTTPAPIMNGLLARRSSIAVAPMGLRRIEAALRADGFSGDEIEVIAPERLSEMVGPRTRVIGVSAGEACGLGMNSTTMTAIAGGEIYPRRKVRDLMDRIAALRVRAPEARVILGGPGAWQLRARDDLRREMGIDHVVSGEAEGNVAQIFSVMIDGDDLPTHLEGETAAVEGIPPIRGPATMGIVELSRGCGLGCRYCVMGRAPMRHLPQKTILADTQTNVEAGLPGIGVISEDTLRYAAEGIRPKPQRLLGLLRRMREIPGMGLIQADHANVISVAGWSDDELSELRELMAGDSGCRYPWINLGVEAADGNLVASVGSGKLGEVDPERWGDFAAEQIRRLIRAGFMPMASLMLRLPGETADHVVENLRWVDALADEPLTIFPMLYAPIDGGSVPSRADLTPRHWRLIQRCYDVNFRQVPRMFWDAQAAVGVPLSRRIALHALGYGQVALWSALFTWRRWRAAS